MRQARCTCGRTHPSETKEDQHACAFFEFTGDGSAAATDFCKCGYHKIAHESNRASGCTEFRAKGPQEFDRYYCGCRGWE